MAVFGYVRVSTKDQSNEYQKNQILHFVNEKKLGNVEFAEDVKSGALSWRDREIGRLVDMMKPKDVLVVNEFSRLGRSLLDVLEIIKLIKENECQIYVVRENLKIGDDLNSKMMVMMFSLVAEIERDLIRGRVKEGLENAKRKGVKLGRKKGIYKSKLDDKHDEIIQLREKGVSKMAISKLLEVNYQTLNSFIRKRKIA